MEYIETAEEKEERTRRSLFRLSIISGSIFALLAVLNLVGNLTAGRLGWQVWLAFIYFLVPAVLLIWAYLNREPARPRNQWFIRLAGFWISLCLFAFPLTLSQSPVAALLIVGVFTLGMALLISSLRFRQ